MQPFYEDPYSIIYCGNCLDILPQIPAGSIDICLTDPPFMISSELKISRQRNPVKYARKEYNITNAWKFRGRDINYNFGTWDFFESKEKFLAFTRQWAKECIRVLKPGGNFLSWFDKAKVSHLYDFLEGNGMTGHGILTHILSNPVPQARKVKFMQATYSIVWASKKGARHTFNWELGEHPDYIETSICQGNERVRNSNGDAVHPTQKPLDAMRWLISYLSKPGDIVLDPFVGTGSTLVAAKELGRRSIGIEINTEFCKVARSRVEGVALPMVFDLVG